MLENSIDAGATSIIITLKNYGIDEIEIIDNGKGIVKEDLLKICQRGATSKLKEEDIEMNEVDTLGFRGEALFGLSQLSHELQVTSKTENQEKVFQFHS